ncbi:MAG: hypothetical protein HQK79_20435 [Desulfobacterales bacterium]|nr:hypothetical protein [Desulfobacterales bacterium]
MNKKYVNINKDKDKENVTYGKCKEYRNEAYIALEDIINSSESSLRSEIRHAAIGIKAYIDRKNNELKEELIDKIDDVKTNMNKLETDMGEIKTLLNQLILKP